MKSKQNIAALMARFICTTCLLLIGALWLTAPVHAQQTFSLGGQTADNTKGAALPDVTVTLTGTISRTTQTDGAGMFSFTGLTAGGNYEITPSKPGYTFFPTSVSYTNLNGSFTTSF